MTTQHLRIDKTTFTVQHALPGPILTLTVPEGDQATYRADDGSMYIDVTVALEHDELDALIALLTGRQIATSKP